MSLGRMRNDNEYFVENCRNENSLRYNVLILKHLSIFIYLYECYLTGICIINLMLFFNSPIYLRDKYTNKSIVKAIK